MNINLQQTNSNISYMAHQKPYSLINNTEAFTLRCFLVAN